MRLQEVQGDIRQSRPALRGVGSGHLDESCVPAGGGGGEVSSAVPWYGCCGCVSEAHMRLGAGGDERGSGQMDTHRRPPLASKLPRFAFHRRTRERG